MMMMSQRFCSFTSNQISFTFVESVAEPEVESQEGRLILHAVQVLQSQTGTQQRAHLSRQLAEEQPHKNIIRRPSTQTGTQRRILIKKKHALKVKLHIKIQNLLFYFMIILFTSIRRVNADNRVIIFIRV